MTSNMKKENSLCTRLPLGAVYRYDLECQYRGMTIELTGVTVGLATTDLKVVVVYTIMFVLGLLAFFQMLVLLHAGFVLLTAGADEERRHEAKITVLRSVVGVLVIGAAWAIVTFLFRVVGNVAG